MRDLSHWKPEASCSGNRPVVLNLRFARALAAALDNLQRVSTEPPPQRVLAVRLGPRDLGQRITSSHGRGRRPGELIRRHPYRVRILVGLCAQARTRRLRYGGQLILEDPLGVLL